MNEIDLRMFVERAADLLPALESLDAVWINGGNAFVLRRAMRLSGFDTTMDHLLREDRILYAGF